MTLALLGVFVMQVYYIKESYKLNSRLFEENVNQALSAVVNKIQKKNVVTSINKKDDEAREQREQEIQSKTDSIVAFKVRTKESERERKLEQNRQISDYVRFQDSVIRATFMSPIMISEEEYKIYSNPKRDPNNKLSLDVEDIKDINGNLLDRRISTSFLRRRPILQIDKLPDTIRYIAFSPENLLPRFVSFPSRDPDLLSKFKVEDAKASRKNQMELDRLYADTANLFSSSFNMVVQDAATEYRNKDVPLEERIPPKKILDTLLKRELLSKNIKLDYNYWLTPAKDKSKIIYQNIAHVTGEVLPKNTFEHVVFSNDVAIKDPGMLYVSFPNVSSLIFSNMFATLASSVALLLVLIFIFTYTILAIIRQKKLSEMKTDFINNMTHEFKTPVATIMIASEALRDPEVVEDKSRISRLANIIYDENVRLGNHIERVLSVARLEKKELKLEYAPVNVNDLITAVVDSMGLQLQKRNAKVTLNLHTSYDLVMSDELHLSNVIYNLIDNANKYSVDAPNITISTRNNAKNVYIQIADEGIGMTKEQTKRIFDQFYRVHTGNLHDVKGFGLGLNYVQDILAQMGGSIKVQSEKDKGTTFEITIPFKHSN